MTTGISVDLNSDLGEGFGPWSMGDDAAMLDIVSSANLACGFHAGDPVIMTDTARLAREKGVAIGAHPAFLDLWGFGRRRISGDSPADIEKMVAYQIGALQGVAALAGHRVSHVKPHGALYNMAAADPALANAIANAIRAVDRRLLFVVLPGSEMERAGRAAGLGRRLRSLRRPRLSRRRHSGATRPARRPDPRSRRSRPPHGGDGDDRQGPGARPAGRSRSRPTRSASTATAPPPSRWRERCGAPWNRPASRSAPCMRPSGSPGGLITYRIIPEEQTTEAISSPPELDREAAAFRHSATL